MDNCLTSKKAITKLNSLTGVKWVQWHGKNSTIKRCVVTLTPTDATNINSPMHYFMPLGKPPVTDPELFVKMYLKPKSNSFIFLPSVKFDLDNAPEIEFNPYPYGNSVINFSARVKGQVVVSKQGHINNVLMSVNNLKSVEVNAGITLKNFKDSFNIRFDSNSKQLTLGCSVPGVIWTTTVEIHGNTITANISHKPVYIPMPGYDIKGQVGFEISGTIIPRKPNMNPVPAHSAVHASDIKAGLEVILITYILQPYIKLRDILGPLAS